MRTTWSGCRETIVCAGKLESQLEDDPKKDVTWSLCVISHNSEACCERWVEWDDAFAVGSFSNSRRLTWQPNSSASVNSRQKWMPIFSFATSYVQRQAKAISNDWSEMSSWAEDRYRSSKLWLAELNEDHLSNEKVLFLHLNILLNEDINEWMFLTFTEVTLVKTLQLMKLIESLTENIGNKLNINLDMNWIRPTA